MSTYFERWRGIEQADRSRGIPQCPYVWYRYPDEDIRYLNCGRRDGHDGPHMDCYGFQHDKWELPRGA